MGILEKARNVVPLVALCLLVIGARETFRASATQQSVPPEHSPQSSSSSSRASDGSCSLALAPKQIRIPGAVIDVSFAPGRFDLPQEDVVAWVRRAATAVSTYYGTFPVPHATVRIVPVEGEDGVFHGTTFGKDGGFTRIPLGEHTTADELNDDWVMTHEFVHLAFPDMPMQHHWIEEGLATYVEPIARAQAGQLRPAKIWKDLIRDIPQGEPDSGDHGLDHTHTWARTYWGGALYCLRADVRIRRLTKNRKGLQDALRAIVASGGTLEKENWSLPQALRIGDRATGTRVLERLYSEMAATPERISLDRIWNQLGISSRDGRVSFTDRGPRAATRLAIVRKAGTQVVLDNSDHDRAAEAAGGK